MRRSCHAIDDAKPIRVILKTSFISKNRRSSLATKDRTIPAVKFSPQAQEALKQKLTQALKGLGVINNEILAAWDPALNVFASSCEKYFGEWFSAEDIITFIFEEAPPVLRELNAGLKKDSIRPLSAAKSRILADKLVTLLERFPRQYEIFFPLPHMQIIGTVVLSETVSLVAKNGNRVPSLSAESLFRGLPSQNEKDVTSTISQQMFLRVSARGYAANSRVQSAIQNSVALLKRSVQIALVKNAFALDGDYPGFMRLSTGDADPVESHPALTAIISSVDAERPDRHLSLGRDISNFLNRVSIYTTNSMRKKAPAYIRQDEIEADLLESLSVSFNLLTNETTNENNNSLRRSFEWAFDALAGDEIVHGYINTCIALEAALGEDVEVGAITERLADRAAYLLGKTQAQRSEVRADIREIYRLRSKLVHGATTTISNQDQPTRKLGRQYLDKILAVELNGIERWTKGLD